MVDMGELEIGVCLPPHLPPAKKGGLSSIRGFIKGLKKMDIQIKSTAD